MFTMITRSRFFQAALRGRWRGVAAEQLGIERLPAVVVLKQGRIVTVLKGRTAELKDQLLKTLKEQNAAQ